MRRLSNFPFYRKEHPIRLAIVRYIGQYLRFNSKNIGFNKQEATIWKTHLMTIATMAAP